MSELIYKQAADIASPELGVIEATLSKFGNVDRQGDIMEIGCFDAWMLKNGDKPLRMMNSHRLDEFQLGEWVDFKLDSSGLKATGKLDIDFNPSAKVAANLIKQGKVNGVSIGFQLLKGDSVVRKDGTRGRNIYDADLKEASVVAFDPANELATVESIDGESVSSVYKSADYVRICKEAMEEWRLEQVAREALYKVLGR